MNEKRILIVDDDEQVLTGLALMISSNGYATETAGGGARALEMMRRMTFDLVLLDVIMRGMDGIEVLREIRRLSPQTAVMLISGYSESERILEALRTGASDYIVKPCDEEELIARVERTLSQQHPTE